MFYIDNTPILTSDIEVIKELKTQLKEAGIERFEIIKEGQDNLMCSCPMHNEGQEKRPSCGISTINQEDVPAGTVHCFTCGYTASLEQMISDCFNKNDGGMYGKYWLIKNFLRIEVAERKKINLDFTRDKVTQDKVKYIDDKELDTYRYYHPYMYKRKLTDVIIEQFDIGYDKHFELKDKFGNVTNVLKCLTFPIRDVDGNTLFIARRSVDIKFFHYPAGVEKPIYGLYEMDRNTEELIICEGILDALTCNVYGKQAVSLLGLGTRLQMEQLKKLKCRKIITAFDADEAGYKATERLKKALRGYKIVTTYNIPPGKDMNDLTKEEFLALEEIL